MDVQSLHTSVPPLGASHQWEAGDCLGLGVLAGAAGALQVAQKPHRWRLAVLARHPQPLSISLSASTRQPRVIQMDYQTLINVGAGTALAVIGWFARELWGAVKELRGDLSRLREELARDYLTKDDFKDAVRELRDLLVRIENKLDQKADK